MSTIHSMVFSCRPCFLKPLALAISAISFSLSVSAEDTKLNTVVVRAQRIEQELLAEQAATPGSVTVVDGEELFQRNVSSLADMLRYVPGVWVANGATADSTFFSSRGSNLDATNYDGNGIKLMQDGLPVTTADGNNHNRDIDPLSARYAIVAHGANALTYGASTLGGAIDFITPTARDSAPLEIFLNTGSHGQVQGRITAGAVAGRFDGLITAEAKRWDGYRAHHEQEREGLYANTGWQFSDAVNTRLYLTYIDNHQELPGALTRDEWRDDPEQAQAAAVTGNYQLNVKTWRIANKTIWDIDSNSSLSVGFSFEDQQLYHPIVHSPYFSLLIDTTQRNGGASVRYNLHLDEHDFLTGFNYGQSEVEGGNYTHEHGHRKNLTTRVDNDADSLELFIVDRWQFAPKWTVVYGAQSVSANREVRNVAMANGAVRNPRGDYASINPRAGLIHQLTPAIELFANISRLYEAPTNYELEDDARGNEEALKAMHGTVVEAGTRGVQPLGKFNQWHWDIALYYAKLHDEILSKDDPDAPGTSLSTNVDDTFHTGIETLIGASFALDAAGNHRLEPLVNVTLNRFKFNNDSTYDNNDLPAAPKYAVKGELLYRNTQGYFAGPTYDVVGKRYADFSNTYQIDSYTLLGFRIGLVRERWEAYGELRNLTDKKYISVFSVKDQAGPNDAILTPGEPRSMYVGMRMKF